MVLFFNSLISSKYLDLKDILSGNVLMIYCFIYSWNCLKAINFTMNKNWLLMLIDFYGRAVQLAAESWLSKIDENYSLLKLDNNYFKVLKSHYRPNITDIFIWSLNI